MIRSLLIAIATLAIVTSTAVAQQATRPHARDVGVVVGIFPPGQYNAIADVPAGKCYLCLRSALLPMSPVCTICCLTNACSRRADCGSGGAAAVVRRPQLKHRRWAATKLSLTAEML